MDAPVTLVIKAPNQKIIDQTVECGLSWTVKKLKEHLASVYPSQPEEHCQKIIYSGKLLENNVKLSDVLRQNDEELSAHTMHLVCANSKESSQKVPDPASHTDGVRRRHVQPREVSETVPADPQPTHAAPWTQHTQQAHLSRYYSMPANLYQLGSQGPMYGGMAPMTSDQLAWMQQAYYHQMHAAMQYYQQYQPVQDPGVTSSPPPEQAEPARPDPPAARDPPEQRLNAQGGMFDVDDDEEGGHRDWLDWGYTLCRLLVLVSIVYFYSNISRFFLVCGLCLLVYMYQTGWFSLRRRVPAPAPAPEPEPEEPAVEEPEPDQPQIDDELASEDDAPAETAPATPAAAPAPAGPGVPALAWSFVTTFFTSLFPQPPPHVDAN